MRFLNTFPTRGRSIFAIFGSKVIAFSILGEFLMTSSPKMMTSAKMTTKHGLSY